MEKYQLEISYQTIFKIIFVIFFVAFLFIIKEVVLSLFAAFVVSTVVNPTVDWAEKKKFPRSLATILIYVFVFFFIGLLFYLITPPLIKDLTDLTTHFPQYIEKSIAQYPFLEIYHIKENIEIIFAEITDFTRGQLPNLFFSTVSALSNLFYVFLALAVSFYLSAEKNLVKNSLRKVIHQDHHLGLIKILDEVETKMGRWLWGQIILSITSSFIIFLGLSVLGVPSALFLAIMAAILRFVPYLGGLISDGLGVLIAFSVSPLLGLMAFVMYYAVQQIEGYILIPYVMEKTLGLNPILVIVAVVVGGQIGGIIGALFAIPVTIVIVILSEELFFKHGHLADK